MNNVSITGNDIIIINDRIITAQANDDVTNLEFPEDLVNVTPGKNNNVLYAFKQSGRKVICHLRVMLGSPDDKFLNSLLNSWINDPPSFALIAGEFTKRVGDGSGNINSVTYSCEGGAFQKIPEAKDNTEGDVTQSVAEYLIIFGNGSRAIL